MNKIKDILKKINIKYVLGLVLVGLICLTSITLIGHSNNAKTANAGTQHKVSWYIGANLEKEEYVAHNTPMSSLVFPTRATAKYLPDGYIIANWACMCCGYIEHDITQDTHFEADLQKVDNEYTTLTFEYIRSDGSWDGWQDNCAKVGDLVSKYAGAQADVTVGIKKYIFVGWDFTADTVVHWSGGNYKAIYNEITAKTVTFEYLDINGNVKQCVANAFVGDLVSNHKPTINTDTFYYDGYEYEYLGWTFSDTDVVQSDMAYYASYRKTKLSDKYQKVNLKENGNIVQLEYGFATHSELIEYLELDGKNTPAFYYVYEYVTEKNTLETDTNLEYVGETLVFAEKPTDEDLEKESNFWYNLGYWLGNLFFPKEDTRDDPISYVNKPLCIWKYYKVPDVDVEDGSYATKDYYIDIKIPIVENAYLNITSNLTNQLDSLDYSKYTSAESSPIYGYSFVFDLWGYVKKYTDYVSQRENPTENKVYFWHITFETDLKICDEFGNEIEDLAELTSDIYLLKLTFATSDTKGGNYNIKINFEEWRPPHITDNKPLGEDKNTDKSFWDRYFGALKDVINDFVSWFTSTANKTLKDILAWLWKIFKALPLWVKIVLGVVLGIVLICFLKPLGKLFERIGKSIKRFFKSIFGGIKSIGNKATSPKSKVKKSQKRG